MRFLKLFFIFTEEEISMLTCMQFSVIGIQLQTSTFLFLLHKRKEERREEKNFGKDILRREGEREERKKEKN